MLPNLCGLKLQLSETNEKYYDEDLKKWVRKVEFKKGPKEHAKAENCIAVPWPLIEKKRTTLSIDLYIEDVHRDPRGISSYLSDLGLKNIYKNFEKTASRIRAKNIQAYANVENQQNASKKFNTTEDTVWVMEYNNELSKYCLVPFDSVELVERVTNCIAHIERMMDDFSMNNFKRSEALKEDDYAEAVPESLDSGFVQYKQYHVSILSAVLEEMRPARR